MPVNNSQENVIPANISGLVLAGGRARRMGGRDKGLITLDGRPLITHCLETFAPQVNEIFVSANRNLGEYQAYGCTVLRDHHDNFDGPLAGLQRALEVCEHDWLAVVPCDAPMLPRDLVTRLLEARNSKPGKPGKLAIVPHDGNRVQPLFGLYSVQVRNALDKFLRVGDRKVQIWLDSLHPLQVDFSDQPRAFMNINTTKDLAAARQVFENHPHVE
ncbi:MAG: molybdenum cofactor guanylyltransferase [Gammaproteobacteria bacterium]|nr:molybdenum cofactor guanylyltransferase [Gammaproteobacteria bacterium]